jgi:hypothetical protein
MRCEGRFDSGLRQVVAAALTLAALNVPTATVFAASDEGRTDVRTFVTRFYPHGIPYADAKALGARAVPELVSILKDPALEEHWTKAVWVLGCIGDSSATRPLVEFLERQHGEVSVHAFRATLAVLPALGHLARAGDAVAVQKLTSFTRPDGWKDAKLAFTYGRYRGASMGEVLGRTAIQGLGIAGTPETLVVLESLNRVDLRPDWQDNVKEALALNARVARLGAERAFAEEVKE